MPFYQMSRGNLEGYETVQVTKQQVKTRIHPSYMQEQPNEQVRINIHVEEMC